MFSRLQPEATFDGYKLKSVFPRGRGGEAWIAKKIESGEEFVIKLPAFDDSPGERNTQRKDIETEADFLKEMQSFAPPVVRFVDQGTLRHTFGERYPYIVLEKVAPNFEPLPSILIAVAETGQLPVLELLDIFDWVLQTLEKAHERDIVYRDVDIKHVFWDRGTEKEKFKENGRNRVRIIDWGNSIRDKSFLEDDIEQAGEMLRDMFTAMGNIPEAYFAEHYAGIFQLAERGISKEFEDIPTFRLTLETVKKSYQTQMKVWLYGLNDEFEKCSSKFAQDREPIPYFNLTTSILDRLDGGRDNWHTCYEEFLALFDKICLTSIRDAILFLSNKIVDDFRYATHQIHRSRYDDHFKFIQNVVSRLSDYEREQKTRLRQCIDYMLLTYELMHWDYESQQNNRSNKNLYNIVTESWKGFLNKPKVNVIPFELLLNDDVLPMSFEEWSYAAHAALIFFRVVDLDSQAVPQPLDCYLIDILLDNDLLNHKMHNSDVIQHILNWHNMLSDLAATGNTSIISLIPIYKQLQDNLKEYEQAYNALSIFIDSLKKAEDLTGFKIPLQFDLWHKSVLDGHQAQIANYQKQFSSLQNFYCRSSRTNWEPVTDGDQLDLWVSNYDEFLREFNLINQGKAQFYIKLLIQFQSDLETVRIAIGKENTNTAQKNSASIINILSELAPAAKSWFDTEVQLRLRNAQGDFSVIWNIPIGRQKDNWDKIKDICNKILNLDMAHFDARNDLSRYYNNLIDYVQNWEESAGPNLGSLLSIVKKLSTIDPSSYDDYKPDIQRFSASLSHCPLKTSVSSYLEQVKLLKKFTAIKTFSAAKDISDNIEPEKDLPTLTKDIRMVLLAINEVQINCEAVNSTNLKDSITVLTQRIIPIKKHLKDYEQTPIHVFIKNIEDAQLKLDETLGKLKIVVSKLEGWWDYRHIRSVNDPSNSNDPNQSKSRSNVPYEEIDVDIRRLLQELRNVTQNIGGKNKVEDWQLNYELFVRLSKKEVIDNKDYMEFLNGAKRLQSPLLEAYEKIGVKLPQREPHDVTEWLIYIAIVSCIVIPIGAIIFSFLREPVKEPTQAIVPKETNTSIEAGPSLTTVPTILTLTLPPTETVVATHSLSPTFTIEPILTLSATLIPSPIPDVIFNPQNQFGYVEILAQVYSAPSKDALVPTIIPNNTYLSVQGKFENKETLYYLVEYENSFIWVSSEEVNVNPQFAAVLPEITPTNTPIPPTPFPILEIEGERDISPELDLIFRNNYSRDPLIAGGPISLHTLQYYFARSHLRYVTEYGNSQWSIIPQHVDNINPLSHAYVPIPFHNAIHSTIFDKKPIISYRVEGGLLSNESATTNVIYGINAVLKLPHNKESDNIIVLWLIALVPEGKTPAEGVIELWISDASKVGDSIPREWITAMQPTDTKYSVANVLPKIPYGEKFLDIQSNVNISQINLGFVNKNGKIGLAVNNQLVITLDEYDFVSIEQFTCIVEPTISAYFSGIFVKAN